MEFKSLNTEPKPKDTDMTHDSPHHTIGYGRTQAAPGDVVQANNARIKTLEARIAALEKVEEAVVTANIGGAWAQGSDGGSWVAKQGHIVTLTLNMSKATWGAGETVGYIPVGYRPQVPQCFASWNSATGVVNSTLADTDGIIYVNLAATGGGGLVGTVSWMVA